MTIQERQPIAAEVVRYCAETGCQDPEVVAHAVAERLGVHVDLVHGVLADQQQEPA